jgi:hypothetical protein
VLLTQERGVRESCGLELPPPPPRLSLSLGLYICIHTLTHTHIGCLTYIHCVHTCMCIHTHPPTHPPARAHTHTLTQKERDRHLLFSVPLSPSLSLSLPQALCHTHRNTHTPRALRTVKSLMVFFRRKGCRQKELAVPLRQILAVRCCGIPITCYEEHILWRTHSMCGDEGSRPPREEKLVYTRRRRYVVVVDMTTMPGPCSESVPP